MRKGYMYILECSDDTYYTGSTTDIDRRFNEHLNKMGAIYTSKRLPIELIYYEEYDRIEDAFKREHQVKKWSHTKKHALINGDYSLLSNLAKKVYNKNK